MSGTKHNYTWLVVNLFFIQKLSAKNWSAGWPQAGTPPPHKVLNYFPIRTKLPTPPSTTPPTGHPPLLKAYKDCSQLWPILPPLPLEELSPWINKHHKLLNHPANSSLFDVSSALCYLNFWIIFGLEEFKVCCGFKVRTTIRQ